MSTAIHNPPRPRRKQAQNGAVALKAGSNVWNLRYRLNGKRIAVRLGTLAELPDKEAARRIADSLLIGIREREASEKAVRRLSAAKLYKTHKCPQDVIEKKLAIQGNRCIICGREEKLHLDHCHYTNVTRDMLCAHCNMGLGHFRDNPILLRAAALYLEKHGR